MNSRFGALRPAALLLLPLSLLLLVPAPLQAGGFTFPENTTRGAARGGAMVAGVDDASALYFNPAALSRINRASFVANANIIDYRLSFQRAPMNYSYFDELFEEEVERTTTYRRVENESRPYVAPMVFGAARVADTPLVLAGGVYGPSSVGRLRFPEYERVAPEPDRAANRPEPRREGGQAGMLTEQDVLLFYPSIAASWTFESIGLSLGATAQLAVALIDYRLTADGGFSLTQQDGDSIVYLEGQQERENPAFLSPTRLKADGVAPTMILGALWEATPNWAFGFSLRPPFTLKASGTIDVDFPPQLESAFQGSLDLTDDSIELSIKFPLEMRLGAMYRNLNIAGHERFNVELNLVYEGWSRLEQFEVRPAGAVSMPSLYAGEGTLRRDLPEIDILKQYRDTLSIRVGADTHPIRYDDGEPRLTLRFGGFYETAATRPEYSHLDFYSPMRFSGSAGAGYTFQHRNGHHTSIDLGLSLIFSPDRTVEEGRVEALVPIWICEDPIALERSFCQTAEAPAYAINEGDWTSHMTLFSVGLSHRW